MFGKKRKKKLTPLHGKGLRQHFRELSYMQLSYSIFVIALLLLILLLVLAVREKGNMGYGAGVWGVLDLLLAAVGFTVPLYGHFIVRMDRKEKWKRPVCMNGGLLLVLVFLYFLGA